MYSFEGGMYACSVDKCCMVVDDEGGRHGGSTDKPGGVPNEDDYFDRQVYEAPKHAERFQTL